MNREEIIAELVRMIEDDVHNVHGSGYRASDREIAEHSYIGIARQILDWLDDIGYDPCYELGINIHGHHEGWLKEI